MRGLLVITLALFNGCALAPKLVAPQLTIVGVELRQSDFFSQRIKVKLHVQNPNNRALPVRGITCDLQVAGEKFAHGVSASEFTVPALGETDFDMLLTADVASALLRVLSGDKNNLDYRMTGTVNLASGLIRSIPFSQSGKLPLR